MTAVIRLPYSLPSVSSSHKVTASSTISAPKSDATLLPAGPSYISHTRRQLHQLDFDADDAAESSRLEELKKLNATDGEDEDLPEEEESRDLLDRDPKDWKTQDHYAVLGLSAFRHKATQNQIKVAHRRKVLKHHPDKKAGASGLVNDDAFFKCIAKAHDVLSNAESRRQFDSVDEAIDDENVPTGKESESKFYDLWAPVFERESRFNDEKKNGKVLSLGDKDSTKSDVNAFYDFWYNFDSWRSFEYLDKEINEGNDNRDHKRFTEKKNKNDRSRRKKEDNARLRNLVDKALSIDPRIKNFKAEEKASREAKKNKSKAGANGASPAQLAEEKKKKEEEEKKQKESEAKKEEDEKAARADAKKSKEAAKKNLKKHKKVLRDLITSNNYFEAVGSTPSAQVIEAKLNGLDAICAALSEEPEQVQALRERCEKAGKADAIKSEMNSVAQEKGVAKEAFV
ncbi:hypothetical protein CBS101457_001528 [Exobasidium rhododendri]|nr:hypothetical protein CBS101457_001528 [Exobasidium rhododendri]